MAFVLSVASKLYMLNVIMLNVIMLNVVAPKLNHFKESFFVSKTPVLNLSAIALQGLMS
jgi:hypothetical protein